MTAHAPVLEQLLPRAGVSPALALGQLLELYRGYLAVLARYQIGRRLRGKADASDLIQETFLEAYRDFGQFRGSTEAELVCWLRRILATNLANLVGRYCGTQRRDVRREQALAEEFEPSSGACGGGLASPLSSPSHQAARHDQAAQLAGALEQLPGDYRQVLVLRHLEELSFAEVAARMGRSLDSVKNLWARALVRLRRQLGGPS
jgi:RNA polymerase sigma-70 factor (ECF subfamily)